MGGHRGHAWSGHKLLNTQRGVGRRPRKSPSMKWANTLEESSRKFPEAQRSLSQQHQLVHWSRWAPRTLTPQGSRDYKGPALQKRIPVFLGGSLFISFQNFLTPSCCCLDRSKFLQTEIHFPRPLKTNRDPTKGVHSSSLAIKCKSHENLNYNNIISDDGKTKARK